MDNDLKQINRLIKKDLFDERVKEQKQKNKKIKIVCSFVFIAVILLLSIFFYQLLNPSLAVEKEAENTPEKIEAKSKKADIVKSIFPLRNKNQKEINILALGKPGDGHSGGELTDTIILIHLEQDDNNSNSGRKAFLISLPRDLLVKIPGAGNLAKINSLYNAVGIEALKEKIKEITGLPVDNYIMVDLALVKEVISLIGGLNVFIEQDIDDPYFPGPNYSHQTFNISAGWRYLDGPTTLKYIRTRYTSPNGDFDRMSRQQQIIQLLKQKVLALNPLWDFPTYMKIFNSMQNHIETDLGLFKIKSLWGTAKEIDSDNIISLVIDKKRTGLLTGGQVIFGEQRASVVYPNAGQGNYEEIKKFIKRTIGK
ncbi:MAG: LCP family protein [Patescibacteria group bacterium]|nr:LCP family protein [Patescibacteria group bacterium]